MWRWERSQLDGLDTCPPLLPSSKPSNFLFPLHLPLNLVSPWSPPLHHIFTHVLQPPYLLLSASPSTSKKAPLLRFRGSPTHSLPPFEFLLVLASSSFFSTYFNPTTTPTHTPTLLNSLDRVHLSQTGVDKRLSITWAGVVFTSVNSPL